MKNRTNQILLCVFLMSLAVYCVIFASCFSELPINPSPIQQRILLYFHGIPMFFLHLLLYRLSVRRRLHLVSFLPILVVGLVFMYFAEWYILGWILVFWWCTAPIMGWFLAWAVSFPGRRRVQKEEVQ